MAGKPGPKPKGTPRRQVLNSSVEPWVMKGLDQLVSVFQTLQLNLPDWYKLPDSRSSAAAWVLERRLAHEIDCLNYLLGTFTDARYPGNQPHDYPEAPYPIGTPLEVLNDPFLSGVLSGLIATAEKELGEPVTWARDLKKKIEAGLPNHAPFPE